MEAGSALQAVIAGIAFEPGRTATSRNERIIADTARCFVGAAIDSINTVVAIIAGKELKIPLAGNNRIVPGTAGCEHPKGQIVGDGRASHQAVIASTTRKRGQDKGCNIHQRVIAATTGKPLTFGAAQNAVIAITAKDVFNPRQVVIASIAG